MPRKTNSKTLAAAPSEPALQRRTRSAHLRGIEVKNSSDVSSDELSASATPAPRLYPSVVIPTAVRPSQAASTTSADSTMLTENSGLDQETPLTSAAATPFDKAGFSGNDAASGRRVAAANLAKVNQKLSSSAKKQNASRKSTCNEDQLQTDEQLAKMLQEQEYEEEEIKPVKRSAGRSRLTTLSFEDEDTKPSSSIGRRKRRFLDTDDEEEEDEFIPEDSPEPVPRKSTRVVTVSKRSGFSLDAESVDLNPKKRRKVKTPVSRTTARSAAKSALQKAVQAASNLDDCEGSEPLSNIDALSDFSDSLSSVGSISETESAENGISAPVARRAKTNWRRTNESRGDFERRRLYSAHPKLETLWDDLANEKIIKGEQGKQPECINRQLKSFQLEGVSWMRKMETEGKWKGGLLGDEMGMGKTIQAVSLIMSDYPAGKPTLVVVPPVALMQWSAEIKSYTDGKLKVLVHHNTDPKIKGMKVKDLMKYDVIMISYSGLESIHRKEVKGWKREGDLIKENSRIHAVTYHRLILDEAHSIKSRTTGVAKACFALKSDYKWCLSGTPVQNRIGEFFSLLRFLEVEPFASYFCKSCDCELLHWTQDEQNRCTKCKHSGFNHVSLFNQELLNPITGGNPEQRTEAMRKLRLLTDRIMLRRLKRDYTSSMELPPKQIIIHNEFFGPEESDFSRSIMTSTSRQFDTYVARGVMLNNYANIFGLIMQMRQVANHPDLILKKHATEGQNVLVCSICDEAAEEPIRSQCHHEFCRRCAKDYVRSFGAGARVPDCPRCHIPLRIDFDQPDIEQDEEVVKKSSIINRIKMDDWHSSTKIEMLIYDLWKLRSKKQTCKSIVFSQFTSMLQLVEWRLRRAGFNTVMLDGSMSPAQRQRSIEYFMNNVDVEVFLVSLKAGGVALNLTEASRVFIVDPWWNPAAEWQSADRCHRIGQKRPCVITRLCIEDSVESRMVMLQEKKANLINSTVNRDDVALEKLTPEDMQFLFRGT